MKVLFNDFKSDPPELREAQARAVSQVMSSGWYVLGPKVEEFEAAWAMYCGTQSSVGVANGMDAIEIILRCRNIGPGDEVITSGMTAFATVLAILRVGATPIFADIDPVTALLDLRSTEQMINAKTRAVLLVHLYGQIKHMSAWTALCERYGIDLIEDCAQAHGAKDEGSVAGSWGIAGAYSFYPTKNLGCVGDGGAIVSNDLNLIERAKRIRNYGQANRYEHVEFGLNSRLDEIQAAMLLERLPYLDSFNGKRRSIASTYLKTLGGYKPSQPDVGFETLAPPAEPGSHVYHLFVGRTKNPDAFVARMKEKGIQVLCHYPIPCYSQFAMSISNVGRVLLPNTDLLASEVVSLPCHPNLTEYEVMEVLKAVINVN